jgi:hypothetical protein
VRLRSPHQANAWCWERSQSRAVCKTSSDKDLKSVINEILGC